MPAKVEMLPPPPLSASRSGLAPGHHERERDVRIMRNGSPPQSSYRGAPSGSHYHTSLRLFGNAKGNSTNGNVTSKGNGNGNGNGNGDSDAWSRRSPRFDDRAPPLSSEAASHRSSDTRATSGRPSSSGLSKGADMDRLPPISAIDPALAEAHQGPTGVDPQGRRLSNRSQASQQELLRGEASGAGAGGHTRSYSAREPATGRVDIDVARSHVRGAQQGSGSSADDWDSERGGNPSLAPLRPYAAEVTNDGPRTFAHRVGNGYRSRRASGGTAVDVYGYEDGDASASAPASALAAGSAAPLTGAGTGSRRTNDLRVYSDALPYDGGDRSRESMRRGDSPPPLPPPSSRSLKRKPSFDDGDPMPPRRPVYDPATAATAASAAVPTSCEREYHYHDRQLHPRSYARGGRGGSPDRDVREAPYSLTAGHDAPYSSLASRYASDMDDPRYSPRHPARSPLPPAPLVPLSGDAYRSSRSSYGQHYEALGPPTLLDSGGGGRYSPMASPSYARRMLPAAASSMPPGAAAGGPHPHASPAAPLPPLPPPPSGADYYGSSSQRTAPLRHRSPSYAPAEGRRPYLPHPSVSSAAATAGSSDHDHDHARSRRLTPPPVEMLSRCSPSPGFPPMHVAHDQPFYPDRRLYYPRDRIEDVDIDEYYNDGPGRPWLVGGHPSSSSSSTAHYGGDPPVHPSQQQQQHHHHYPHHRQQDPYGPSPTTSFLPPPVAIGTHHLGSRSHPPMAIPLSVPPPQPQPQPQPQLQLQHPHSHSQQSLPPPPSSHHRHHDLRHHPDADHHGHGGHDYDPRHELATAGSSSNSRALGVVGIPPPHVPPGPSTGIAPPPRRRGKLPKPVTDLLKSWLLDHASHPYPTEDEKRSLCSMTGLTLQQVSNWFINARRRILLPGASGSNGGGATAEQVQAAFSQDSGSET